MLLLLVGREGFQLLEFPGVKKMACQLQSFNVAVSSISPIIIISALPNKKVSRANA